jgi:hypothetical protein
MKILKAKLTINEKPIGIKTFVQITLGNIVVGLIQDLKEVEFGEESVINLQVNPKAAENKQFILDIDGKNVAVKDYVQQMIWRTIAGFISALEGVPPTFKAILDSSLSTEVKIRTNE